VTPVEIRGELEEEQTWRRDEIRFLRNQIANMRSDTEKDKYRRSLVVMLYAHYEGFCKAALLQYVRAVNEANLRCGDVVPAIVATSWMNIFKEIENAEVKSRIFRALLPDDTQLHRFARRRHFVEQITEFHDMAATLPEEAVDVEDNLSPIVMKKVLFRVGIEHDAFASHDGDILFLLNRRNNISHGVERKGIEEKVYERLEQAVFKIMDDLMDMIIDSIRNEIFKRKP
jgi:MAE_28990/MAE_18760-like HEPN